MDLQNSIKFGLRKIGASIEVSKFLWMETTSTRLCVVVGACVRSVALPRLFIAARRDVKSGNGLRSKAFDIT